MRHMRKFALSNALLLVIQLFFLMDPAPSYANEDRGEGSRDARNTGEKMKSNDALNESRNSGNKQEPAASRFRNLKSKLPLFGSGAARKSKAVKDAASGLDREKEKEESKMAGRIAVNDKAPDVALPDQHGKIISLKDFRGKKVVVFYFYPKDNTSVCTAEACSFRDSYEAFSELGAEVIGVSSDSVDSHHGFAEKHHLQFPLLADTGGMARKAFGVPNSAGLIPGRVTYVIDKEGIVRYVFNSMLDGAKHVTEAMKIVKELCSGKPSG